MIRSRLCTNKYPVLAKNDILDSCCKLPACCKLPPTLARQIWRHNYVIGRNEYLVSTLSESTFPWVYSLQILFKSTHHSWRYPLYLNNKNVGKPTMQQIDARHVDVDYSLLLSLPSTVSGMPCEHASEFRWSNSGIQHQHHFLPFPVLLHRRRPWRLSVCVLCLALMISLHVVDR